MAHKKKAATAMPLGLPSDYAELLESLKARVQQAQTKAMLSVNRELIRLYWDIGREIVYRQEQAGWGKSVVDRLAGDLQQAFPGIGGFSPVNIWRMRAFYLAYRDVPIILSQPVTELGSPVLSQAVTENEHSRTPQPVAEIPWGHNQVLLFKLKDRTQRLWYAAKTLEHGWSRAVLTVQIEADLYGRQGKAITNFTSRLPAAQSDLAQESLKDPYLFDFLTLREDAVDTQMSHASDAPAIGLILCKTRDRIIAEYALRDIAKPIGVAEWQTKLVQSLPDTLKGSLPSIEEIEAEFGKEEGP